MGSVMDDNLLNIEGTVVTSKPPQAKMGSVMDDNLQDIEGSVVSSKPPPKRKRRSSVRLLGKVLQHPKYYEREEYMEMAVSDIKKAWSGHIYSKNYSIKVHEDGFLRFNIMDPVDKKWVMDQRPWVLDWQDFLLVLGEWPPSIPASLVTVDSCPFWIHAQGIPFELLSTELGFEIGKVFGGDPMQVEVFSEKEGEAPNCLGIRVMVNVERRVIGGCWLTLPKNDVDVDDKLLWVYFEYEELPCMCLSCGMIGHSSGRHLVHSIDETECNVLNPGNVIVNYNGGEDEKPVVSEGDILIDMRKIAYESWLDESEVKDVRSSMSMNGMPKWYREGQIVVAKSRSKTCDSTVSDENIISVILQPKP